MKYLSINTVLQSFEGCRNKTQNKFWGMVCIIKAIGERIIPATKYSFSVEKVQTYLEELFRLEDVKKTYSTSNMWSVVFSTYWIDFVPEQMFSSKPNIYDVAAWFYRRTAFEDETTPEQIVGGFMDLLNISKEDSEKWFSFQAVSYSFETQLYSDSNLMDSILKKLSLSNSSNKTLSFEDQTFIKSNPGSLGQAPFVQTLYANQGLQKCLILTQFDFQDFYPMTNNIKTIPTHNITTDLPLQQIFYGAPGTGKSYEIKKLTKGESVIRTTFHPDSDYSTFVGSYKPTMDEMDTQVVPVVVKSGISLQEPGTYKEKRITYKFVMQAFLKAYLGAWKKWADAGDDGVAPQFLVIEEINRGNCAQIFGDLFQLLDRSDNNFSEYPIEADTDLQQEIERAFKEHKDYKLNKAIDAEGAVKDYISNYDSTLSEDIQSGRILLLPPNLYIWATMNTSDQSLFPIDSAFKRRWEWRYIKIAKGRDEATRELLNWTVKFEYKEDDKPFTFECNWWDFIKAINEKIAEATSSDDKKLGYFFCKPKDKNSTTIDEERFVGKVVFYLWNDVFKDEENPIFKVNEGKGEPSFDAFYKEDELGKTVVDTAALRKFMHNVFGENKDQYTETEKSEE